MCSFPVVLSFFSFRFLPAGQKPERINPYATLLPQAHHADEYTAA
jgi:hypothetical protein